MLKNNMFLIYLLAPLMMACGAKVNKDTLVIEGKIIGASNLKVFFDKYDLNNRSSRIITSGPINAEGEFSLQFDQRPENGIYRLRIGTKKSLFVIDGNEKSTISIDSRLNELPRLTYTVKGSPVMTELLTMMQGFQQNRPSAQDIVNKIKASDNVYIKTILAQSVLRGNTAFIDVYKDIQADIEKADVSKEFKESFASFIAKVNRQYAEQQRQAKIKVGAIAPDIALPNPEGEIMRLSDLRGKLVLLDFWASWCRPCRKANPHVVKLYDKYKDQGFTVFSVSLDGIDDRTRARLGNNETRIQQFLKRSKSRWIAAIKQDNLKWDTHVSDLKKWDSKAAAKYGVRAIPRTYLIGRDGKILEINPRYNLEEVIKEHI